MPTAIQVENLTVGYHWENGFSIIIRDLNISIEEGIIFGIAGESGSGKSTFAQSIYNSLRYPGEIESGRVYFKGNDLFPKLLSMKPLRSIELNRS